MLQEFDFAGARQIDALGTFFLYDAADNVADQRIRLLVDGQPIGNYLPGDRITLPKEVKRWNIEPATAGLKGRVVVGNGKVESARMVGAVSINGTVPVSGTVGVTGSVSPGFAANSVYSTQLEDIGAGAGNGRLISAQGNRYGFVIRNTGATTLYLTQDPALVGQSAPIELMPGDSWKEDWAPQIQWMVFSNAAGGRAAVFEYRRI